MKLMIHMQYTAMCSIQVLQKHKPTSVEWIKVSIYVSQCNFSTRAGHHIMQAMVLV